MCEYFYSARVGQKNQTQKTPTPAVPYINVVHWCLSDEDDDAAAISHRLPRSLSESHPPVVHFMRSHLLSHLLLRAQTHPR